MKSINMTGIQEPINCDGEVVNTSKLQELSSAISRRANLVSFQVVPKSMVDYSRDGIVDSLKKAAGLKELARADKELNKLLEDFAHECAYNLPIVGNGADMCLSAYQALTQQQPVMVEEEKDMTVKSLQDIELNVQEVPVKESVIDSPLAGFGCPSFVDTDTTEEAFEDRYARIGVLKEPEYIEANSRLGLAWEAVKAKATPRIVARDIVRALRDPARIVLGF